MNALQRLVKTVEWMATKGVATDKVPEQVAAERLEICERCEHFIKATRQCGKCLCFMDVKTKLVYDPVESVKQLEEIKTFCPVGKWGAFTNN